MKFCSYFYAKSLSIFFLLMALITLTGIIMLPLLYDSILVSRSKSQSLLNINNVDLWGNIPGRLNASLKNKFSFFSLDNLHPNSDVEVSLLNNSLTLDEEVIYENFKFDSKSDQVDFKANSIYKKLNKLNVSENSNTTNTIKHINHALLETLSTLTNPHQYAQSLNSLNILLHRIFISPEEFVLKLFTIFSFDFLIKEKNKVLNTILRNFPNDKALELYEGNSEYSIGSISGLYEWIQILGDDQKISNATWPKTIFNLTVSEVNSVVGKESYLSSILFWYNNNLSFKFSCKSKIKCGPEIIFRQLNDSSVTKSLGFDNLKDLCDKINPRLFPYDTSPEFLFFYENQFSANKNNQNKTSEYGDEISLDDDQLLNAFYDTNNTLLEPRNILDLLFYHQTEDLYQAYMKYKLRSKKQLQFLSEYLFEYLPSILLKYKIDIGENKQENQDNAEIKISTGLSAGFTSFLSVAVGKTYPKFKNTKVILISKILERKIFNIGKNETFCQEIISNIANVTFDSICSQNETNMKTYQSLKTWILPYECIVNNKTCSDDREDEKSNLKKLTNFTDDQLVTVYSTGLFNELLSEILAIVKSTYNCETCSETQLAILQWQSSKISFNPPKIISDLSSSSLHSWDTDEFQFPQELGYFLILNKCFAYDCYTDKSLDLIFNLSMENTRDSFYYRFQLQKAHSSFYRGYYNSTVFSQLEIKKPFMYFASLQYFIWNTLVNNKMVTEYSANSEDDLLQLINGKGVSYNDQDDYFLEILRSGNYYDNFRPGKKYTTGFNINFEKDDSQTQTMSMYTGYMENESNVRKIASINNYNIFNTKSKVYSVKKDIYEDITTPLYQNAKLNYFYLSDGFQFSNDRSSIHYYDKLSSRVLEFKYSKVEDFSKKLDCNYYVLNSANLTLNLHENFNGHSSIDYESEVATLYDKFSKPWVVSKMDLFKNKNITKYYPNVNFTNLNNFPMNDNYICIDKYSDMVLRFNITLMYSVFTGNYNTIISKLPNNAIIPLYVYSRQYEVDPVSYDGIFLGVAEFSKSRMILLILGLVLTFVFLFLSIFMCCRYINTKGIAIDPHRLLNSEKNEGSKSPSPLF